MGPEPEVTEIGGVAVLSAQRNCFDLMRERGLVEAVVVADAFAGAHAITLPEFFAYADAHRSWPGVRGVRLALSFATTYALSPNETRLRMIVVLAGFPEPYVNVPYWAGFPPELVGHPDLLLLDVPQPAGLEYDGAIHADPTTHEIDLTRENRFLTKGNLPILRYDKVAVGQRRTAIPFEVAECTGYPRRRLQPLDAADFRFPSRRLWW